MIDITAALKAEIGSYTRNEWSGQIGGQEVTLYSKPITPGDISYVTRHQADFVSAPAPAGMAELIIHKAEDEHGNKVFSRGKHLVFLTRMKTNMIGEIFAGLFGDSFATDADDELEARVGK